MGTTMLARARTALILPRATSKKPISRLIHAGQNFVRMRRNSAYGVTYPSVPFSFVFSGALFIPSDSLSLNLSSSRMVICQGTPVCRYVGLNPLHEWHEVQVPGHLNILHILPSIYLASMPLSPRVARK